MRGRRSSKRVAAESDRAARQQCRVSPVGHSPTLDNLTSRTFGNVRKVTSRCWFCTAPIEAFEVTMSGRLGPFRTVPFTIVEEWW